MLKKILKEMTRQGLDMLIVVSTDEHLNEYVPMQNRRLEASTASEGKSGFSGSAGTAVLFDRRLWHASSPNYLEQTRKVLFYGYAYRWIRPKCIMDVDQLREKTTLIRRQLLGATSSQTGYYQPKEEDVPLRQWLKENSIEVLSWGAR